MGCGSSSSNITPIVSSEHERKYATADDDRDMRNEETNAKVNNTLNAKEEHKRLESTEEDERRESTPDTTARPTYLNPALTIATTTTTATATSSAASSRTSTLLSPSHVSIDLQQVQARFTTIFSVIEMMRVNYKQMKQEAEVERRRRKESDSQWEESLASHEWITLFTIYLTQLESDLKQAKLFLHPIVEPLNMPLLNENFTSLTSSLQTIASEFPSIISRHIAFPSSISSAFILTFHVNIDLEILSNAMNEIEEEKMKLMVALKERLSSAASTARTDRVSAQQQQSQGKQQRQQLLSLLNPIDCTHDLPYESRKFLHRTRQSVISKFRSFAGLDTEQPDSTSISYSPLFLLLSSPGHGKTTICSHLIETYPSSITAIHLFRYDKRERVNVLHAIKSLAWQCMQRIDGMEEAVCEVLRRNAISWDGVDLSSHKEVESDITTTAPSSSNLSSIHITSSSLPIHDASQSKPQSSSLDSLQLVGLWNLLLVQPLWILDERKKMQQEEEEGETPTKPSLSASAFSASPRHILLLDALDESESGGNNALLKLLGLIASGNAASSDTNAKQCSLPPWIGLFISARPERHITRSLGRIKGVTTVNVNELNYEENVVPAPLTPSRSAIKAKSKVDAPAASASSTSAQLEVGADLRLFFTHVVKTFMATLPTLDLSLAPSTNSSAPSLSSTSTSSLTIRQQECVTTLLDRCSGSFIHARLMIESYGIDLSWIQPQRKQELQERLARHEYVRGYKLIRLEDVMKFSKGNVEVFYTDFLVRVAQQLNGVNTNRSSGDSASFAAGLFVPVTNHTHVYLSPAFLELKRLLSYITVAVEPLTLRQMQEFMGYATIEEVVKRCECVRTLLSIRPASSSHSQYTSDSFTILPTHTVTFCHKTLRDWFISSDRLDSSSSSSSFNGIDTTSSTDCWHINEPLAVSEIVTKGWNEFLAHVEKSSASSVMKQLEEDLMALQQQHQEEEEEEEEEEEKRETTEVPDSSVNAAANQHLNSSQSDTCSALDPSSLLHYTLRYLPLHCITLCNATKKDECPLEESCLQILVNSLCHQEYLKKRMSMHHQGSKVNSVEVNPFLFTATTSKSQFFELVLEYTHTEAILTHLLARRQTLARTSKRFAPDPVAALKVTSSIRTLERSLRFIRAFQRFYQSEHA